MVSEALPAAGATLPEPPLGTLLLTVGFVALGALGGWSGRRWPLPAFLFLAALYLPARAGLSLSPQACEFWPGWKYVALSFTNYRHVALFGVLYAIAHANLRPRRGRAWRATGVTLAFGALLEIEQALFALGHCRARDLLSDLLGAMLAAAAIGLWTVGRRLRTGSV